MKKILILLLCFSFEGCALKYPAKSQDEISDVRYLRNHDGDTFTIELENLPKVFGHEISVRIKGIDTAEINAKDKCEKIKAVQARDELANLLKSAHSIRLKNVERDKYFRLLAEVWADDISGAELLLSKKLAVPYFGGKKLG